MDLVTRDLKHIWHPCSQMKDYETLKPLEIVGAEGSYLHLKNGKKVIDAISSWWTKTLGHGHPQLKKALKKQIDQFEHVILANTTNETIVELAEQLAQLSQGLNRVMFASDGSSAVEIALKMSLHARKILKEPKRSKFIALTNSYHGETVGCLSVSDLGIYRDAYADLLFDSYYIQPPYVSSPEDPLWNDCESHWQKIAKQCEPWADQVTAVIVEPIVQGAGQMKIYSQDFLKRLRAWTKKNNIHLIADEIMTGFGRTGKMLASEHAGIQPDFLCLAKGLTAGWLPMSVVLTHESLYELFYADYATGRNFLHSHTHSGNVLAASVALQVFKIFQDEKILEQAERLGKVMHAAMQTIAQQTEQLTNVRSIGAIVAADLVCREPGRRLGLEVYQHAMAKGALLRPIGNTIYWLPPLNCSFNTIDELREITQDSIECVIAHSHVDA